MSSIPALLGGCGESAAPGDSDPQPESTPTTIEIQTTVTQITVGETQQFQASVSDVAGNTLTDVSAAWSVTDASVASIDSEGTVIGLKRGGVTVIASISGLADSSALSVVAIVTAVSFDTDSVVLTEGDSAAISVSVVGNDGLAMDAVSVDLRSSDEQVATVANSTVAALLAGAASIIATANGLSDTLEVSVSSAPGGYVSVSIGGSHSCAIDTLAVVRCWGGNGDGQLGQGDVVDRATPTVVSLDAATTIAAGGARSCALDLAGQWSCWGSNISGSLGEVATDTCGQLLSPCNLLPTVLNPPVFFDSLVVEHSFGCALDASGTAYCWGSNKFGALGIGLADSIAAYTAVNTTEKFIQLTVGSGHVCGLLASGQVYCWGSNENSQLGVDSATVADTCSVGGISTFPCSRSPVKVATTVAFAQISAGNFHTCGLTVAGEIYCWGFNRDGGLGDGSTSDSETPVKVASNEVFTRVVGARFSSCALADSGTAWCWGADRFGELGNGAAPGCDSSPSACEPQEVVGGIRFVELAGNSLHLCGLAEQGGLYCWGDNSTGQLGIGVTTGDGTAGSGTVRPVRVIDPN